jgi:predicted RNase H-like HicB family nuclease
VPDLPGCTFSGPTTDEAVAAAPAGIRKYLEFLQDIGEDVDPDAPVDTEVAEHAIEGYQIGYGSPVVFYSTDAAPVTPPEVATTIARFKALRLALLDLVGDLGSQELHAKPPGPGRTLHHILSHTIVGGDDFFLSAAFGKIDPLRANFRLTEKGLIDPRDGARQSLAMTVDHLESLAGDDLAIDLHRGRVRWTTRKALRFLLEWNWNQLCDVAVRFGRPIKP